MNEQVKDLLLLTMSLLCIATSVWFSFFI